MYQYEYVRLKVGKFVGAKCEEHQQIINDYAKRGYRYAGYIPTNTSDYGKLKEIDLIFEIDLSQVPGL